MNLTQNQNQNLTVKRNDTLKLKITVKDADGVAQDITGWAFFFTVKTNIDDADGAALITVDWTTHSDPTNGITILTVPAASTNVTGTKYYDLQAKDGAGAIYTLKYGTLTFDKDVTIRTS